MYLINNYLVNNIYIDLIRIIIYVNIYLDII